MSNVRAVLRHIEALKGIVARHTVVHDRMGVRLRTHPKRHVKYLEANNIALMAGWAAIKSVEADHAAFDAALGRG